MNSTATIKDEMTLDEKLAAIDAMMKSAQDAATQTAKKAGRIAAPIDPSLLTICDGCE